MTGRIDEAASQVRDTLALTRRLRVRGAEAHALCLAGDGASTGGGGNTGSYHDEALFQVTDISLAAVQRAGEEAGRCFPRMTSGVPSRSASDAFGLEEAA